MAQCLATVGGVSFSGATRQSLAMCLASLAVPFRHPHSTPAGTTVLSPRAASGLGDAGFGHGEVDPHTDRAHTDNPPALVAILIERAADSDGERPDAGNCKPLRCRNVALTEENIAAWTKRLDRLDHQRANPDAFAPLVRARLQDQHDDIHDFLDRWNPPEGP